MKTFQDWLLWLLGSTRLSDPYQTASARPGPPALSHGKTLVASPVAVEPSLTWTGAVHTVHPLAALEALTNVWRRGGSLLAGLTVHTTSRVRAESIERTEKSVSGEPVGGSAMWASFLRSLLPAQHRKFAWSVAPGFVGPVPATRWQASAQRSAKYCLPLRSKAMSVSPPPGPGAGMPVAGDAGIFCVMTRKVWPPSTEPNHVLRWVPVPVGPLLKTRPCGSMAISGSPLVWIGSTMVGVSKAIAAASAVFIPPCNGASATAPATRATRVQIATRGRTMTTPPFVGPWCHPGPHRLSSDLSAYHPGRLGGIPQMWYSEAIEARSRPSGRRASTLPWPAAPA